MSGILIQNGTVVDGSGGPRYAADLLVEGGKIARIAPQIPPAGHRVIDAAGLVVAPGFIDGHTHTDNVLWGGTDSYNHLEQGTTTQIAGHCGTSPAPFYEGGLKGEGLSPAQMIVARQAAFTPGSLMRYAETLPLGCNLALYVGHGALRGRAMGYSDARPTKAQMAGMKVMLADAMENGYLGLSSGLVYAPSVYADEAELTELCRHMAPWGGVYTSHIRGEGDTVVQAVAEVIREAENGGVGLVVSHLKVCRQQNAGLSRTLLGMLEAANARGVAAYADQYPFPAGSAPLAAQIPPQYMVGGLAALLDHLRSPEARRRIEGDIFEDAHSFESSIYAAGWAGVLIAAAPKTPEHVGLRISELAERQGKRPMDAYADLLLANEGVGQGIYFSQVEADMLNILRHPLVAAGSDWSDLREHQDPERAAGGHPRGVGTMTRRLELCREGGLRTLEDCVYSMTGLTARAVGLPGQGLLAEGRDANITLFDWETVACKADFLHPFRRNTGIHWVLVNGQVAVEGGRATGLRAGRMLRRGQ